MTRYPGIALTGMALCALLAGCGGSSQDAASGSSSQGTAPATSAAASSPAASSSSPSASATPAAPSSESAVTSSSPTSDGDAGCAAARVDGKSRNAALQALATQVFQDLDCRSETPLTDQLRTLGTSASVKAKAKKADLDLKVTTVDIGVGMSLTDASDLSKITLCQISVIDSPTRAKTLTCV